MAAKRTVQELNYSTPSSAEDKNEWKCTSTPHHTRFLDVDRENFSVYHLSQFNLYFPECSCKCFSRQIPSEDRYCHSTRQCST